MGTIAILREAHKGGGKSKTGRNTKRQISTEEHLYSKQEYNNADKTLNKNYGKENTLIYFDNDRVIKEKFVRTGSNQDLINKFKNKNSELDKLKRRANK